MNQTRTRCGPNLGLLLLIPAAVIVAKAAGRRRAMMMETGWSGPGGRRYGHNRFAGPEGDLGPRTFNLPPWIESALETWHTRSHEASDATKPDASPEA